MFFCKLYRARPPPPPHSPIASPAPLPLRFFPCPDYFSYRKVRNLPALIADDDFRGVLEETERRADPNAPKNGSSDSDEEDGDGPDTHGGAMRWSAIRVCVWEGGVWRCREKPLLFFGVVDGSFMEVWAAGRSWLKPNCF